MKNLDEMTLKEKEQLLRGIIREYQKALLQLKVIHEKEFYPQTQFNIIREEATSYNHLEMNIINYIEKKDNLETLVSFVETVFHSLSKDQYTLLVNDYLEPKERDWWMSYYSRSTYYRIRRKLVDDVLFYLIR